VQHKALLITGVTTNPDIPSRHLKAILYIEVVMYKVVHVPIFLCTEMVHVPKWTSYTEVDRVS